MLTLLALAPLLQVADPPVIRFEPRAFPRPDGGELQGGIGRLTVPEDRTSEAGGAKIELAVARLTSTAERPGPPFVYLAGGPGGSATATATDAESLALYAELLQLGDVVLMDQRGTGRSRPKLVLPSTGDAADLFHTRETAVKWFADNLGAATKKFSADGVDLAHYTTVESAEDIEDLRRALGVESIRLIGHSYGTHLALEVIRRHGAHVAAAALFAVAGPEDVRKLPSDLDAQWARVVALAASDANVGRTVDELDALLHRVVTRLGATPVVVTVPDQRAKAPREVHVGAFGLQLMLAMDLGDTRDFPSFPRLLAELDRGETTTLAGLVEKRLAQFREFNALTWVCRAASEASPERWARIEAAARTSPFGNAANVPFPEVRNALTLPDLGAAFRAPVESSVRTLLVSGSFDCNTPAHQAETVGRGLAGSVALVVENAGHEDPLAMPEVHVVVRRFFAGEDVSGVRLTRPAPRFAALGAK